MSGSPDGRLYRVLAWAGTVPFILCAALSAAGNVPVPRLGDPDALAASYGVLIAAFLAGSHWGLAFGAGAKSRSTLLLATNAVTLVVWFAFLLLPHPVSLVVLAAAFAALLAADRRFRAEGIVTPGYAATRRNVTLTVVAALLVSALTA